MPWNFPITYVTVSFLKCYFLMCKRGIIWLKCYSCSFAYISRTKTWTLDKARFKILVFVDILESERTPWIRKYCQQPLSMFLGTKCSGYEWYVNNALCQNIERNKTGKFSECKWDWRGDLWLRVQRKRPLKMCCKIHTF